MRLPQRSFAYPRISRYGSPTAGKTAQRRPAGRRARPVSGPRGTASVWPLASQEVIPGQDVAAIGHMLAPLRGLDLVGRYGFRAESIRADIDVGPADAGHRRPNELDRRVAVKAAREQLGTKGLDHRGGRVAPAGQEPDRVHVRCDRGRYARIVAHALRALDRPASVAEGNEQSTDPGIRIGRREAVLRGGELHESRLQPGFPCLCVEDPVAGHDAGRDQHGDDRGEKHEPSTQAGTSSPPALAEDGLADQQVGGGRARDGGIEAPEPGAEPVVEGRHRSSPRRPRRRSLLRDSQLDTVPVRTPRMVAISAWV